MWCHRTSGEKKPKRYLYRCLCDVDSQFKELMSAKVVALDESALKEEGVKLKSLNTHTHKDTHRPSGASEPAETQYRTT